MQGDIIDPFEVNIDFKMKDSFFLFFLLGMVLH